MPHQLHATGHRETNVQVDDEARAKRTERLIRLHKRTNRHLWTALLMFHTDPTASHAVFDSSTLMGRPEIGCYICEEPWSEEIHGQKCPGEPTDEPGGPW